jgi:Tol biopolymer transport system component
VRWKWPAISALAIILLGAIGYFLRPALPPPRVLGYTQLTDDGRPKEGLQTDGSRIYFKETVGGVDLLAQVSVTGGQVVPINIPFQSFDLLGISPDGTELLVASETKASSQFDHPLWQVPALGGAPRRLGKLLGREAAWSGSQRGDLVVATGNSLFVGPADGSESQKLVTLEGIPLAPRWSPDGNVLRFTQQGQGNLALSLWEISRDGSGLHQLFSGWHNPPAEAGGVWTPDGKYFLFGCLHGNRTDIWAMREREDLFHKTNHVPVQLTSGPMDNGAGIPSKDGKRLFVIGNQPRAEVVRYDAKSGQFLPYLSGISAGGLSFSRDGQWVAYTAFPEGTLWRSRVDGSERLQLTFARPDTLVSGNSAWSPDGKRIAFERIQLGKPARILVVAGEGGAAEELPTGTSNAEGPSWSADGNVIYFSDAVNFADYNSWSIKSINLATNQVSDLPDSKRSGYASLSPDGHYLLTIAVEQELGNLRLYDFTAKKWLDLAGPLGGGIGSRTWSTDGKYVYFDTVRGKDPALYRVRVADHMLERIVSLKGFKPEAGSITALPWSGVAPDGSPLILRKAGTHEIYALDWEAP